MDIATWLHRLGLQQYEQAFRDNAIDVAVLPELSADDLRDLGVGLVGHRRKLLAAIASLRSGTASAGAAAPTSSAGERRHLTVMFCDLVGSTALSLGRDPEDLRDLIAAYHHAVAEVVDRCEGFVAKYMGDGILIYFGYPRASENDAERAARCALAVVEAVSGLKLAEELSARVGIATGLVVVGGAAPGRDVVGETPNLAARLQSLAAPNTVLIDETTRRLIGGLFECRELGAVEARGFTGTVAAWHVLRPSALASRFEALRALSSTPLVGRSDELEFLSRQWERAKKGGGQVVLLSGEPGIGKSRMAVALAQRLQDEPHYHLRYFCAPHHQATALYPVITHLEHAAGFARDDPPAAKLEKLRQLLGQGRLGHLRRRVAAHAGQRSRNSEQEAEVALLAVAGVRQALIADLLSLPSGGALSEMNLSPQRKKEKTLEALLGQLEDLSRKRPVLMVFEDVHWIDPTSRELLDLIIERIGRLPVLLIITFRPEFRETWGGAPHVSELLLNHLDTSEGAVLADTVAGKALPSEVVMHIAARTDGVPLFVEELTRTVVESGLLREEGDRYALERPIPPFAIPPSLHASLLARLDRLDPTAKQIAQIGAAIGRDFSYELLAAVAQQSKTGLQDTLARLTDAGLVFQRGVPPDAIFLFKHALVQDTAYGTLLRSGRQQLHARIAAALEARFPEIKDSRPELFAQHYAAAGLAEQAVRYWRKAGQRAISRFALMEAIAHLTNAIRLLQDLPPTKEHKEQELGLQIDLGDAFIAAKGHGADETGNAFARAYQLGREIGDAPQLFPVLAGMFVHHHVRAEVGREQEAARELLRLAVDRGDIVGQVMGHRALGDSLLNVGHFSSARAHLERAISLFGLDASPVILGEEIGVASLAFLSLCLAVLGFPETAVARSEEALERARYRVRHPHTLAFALSVYSRLQWVLRNPRRLEDSSNELFLLAAEHDLRYMRARGTIYRGGALVLSERFAEAVALLEEGIADTRAMRAVWLLPFYGGALATAYQRIGRIEEARSALVAALELMRQTCVEWASAELQRLEAELALSTAVPNAEIAEGCLLRAVTTAQQQGAKWWELRAAASLARLRRDQGRISEARDMLAPVYGWFSEGFDTPDLKEAKVLLDELG